jgi:hypothetical protein
MMELMQILAPMLIVFVAGFFLGSMHGNARARKAMTEWRKHWDEEKR